MTSYVFQIKDQGVSWEYLEQRKLQLSSEDEALHFAINLAKLFKAEVKYNKEVSNQSRIIIKPT